MLPNGRMVRGRALHGLRPDGSSFDDLTLPSDIF